MALITGYIINREGTDDTLKSILTVPVSFPVLLFGKLAVGGLLSLFLGITSAVFTVTAALLLGFPGSGLPAITQTAVQITLNCLFLYVAVLPIIAIAARIQNGHLIGAVVPLFTAMAGCLRRGAQLCPISIL